MSTRVEGAVAGPGAAPTGRRRLVPGLLVAAVVTVTLAAVVVDTRTSAAERDVVYAGPGAVTALTGVVLVVAAAVILAHHPRHRVGHVLAGLGGLWAVDGLMESWSAYSLAQGLPGADFAVWFVARLGAFLLLGLPLALVLYPGGRLMPGRWGTASVAVVVAATTLPVLLLVAPDSVVFLEQPVPGVRTDALALPVPRDVMVPLLVAARALTLAALLGALVVVLARHRRADGPERTQLRWLLWAGIVCVLAVAAGLLVSAGLVTTVALAVAVLVTAGSVTVGIVRPGIADVDALVAGTLTCAGVAAVLVGIDLAALATAGALVGDRLDERGVTVAVLVLAVAVYGPLRTWLGRVVRRLLFGGRQDRYGAVSTLAARLEAAGTVEEQLPTLASVVAQTFKVPFVRVEVFVPDGRTVAATHGVLATEVQDLDIAYHGERVGRLVLPRRGLRSMLSRRDQDLLLDLVRQAAIAIRTSLLAVALQDSRERLVLAREDDRRRIRRDLHDGLGPALGGVALRLEAAGSVIDTDPEGARELVRLARTDVREALDDVRRLVNGLRPPALDDLGLVGALEQQADRTRFELPVDVLAEGVRTLPAAVEVAAYRIVSEALTNVVRHAGASAVQVRLVAGETALQVWVRDDGSGIGEDVSAGVGLLSMRERAEELGGQCEVSCPATGGTLVWAMLPLGETREA